jgi:hypothetical protein
MIQKRYLSEKETAEYTGLAVQTLRNDRFNRRGLPYSKKGRRVLYDLKDLDSYMQKHKISHEA